MNVHRSRDKFKLQNTCRKALQIIKKTNKDSHSRKPQVLLFAL